MMMHQKLRDDLNSISFFMQVDDNFSNKRCGIVSLLRFVMLSSFQTCTQVTFI